MMSIKLSLRSFATTLSSITFACILSNIKFDAEIGFMAGSLRAKYALLLPDIFQVAAALAQPANAIITNDRDIQRVQETEVFLLSDLASS